MQGAKIRSSWALKGYGIHLPRKAMNYGDTDDAERSIWQGWFFEAAGGTLSINLAGRGGLAGTGGLAGQGGGRAA